MYDMKIIKFETLINEINNKIIRRKVLFWPILPVQKMNVNTALALIYNYNELNDYGKLIMNHSTICLTNNDDISNVWNSKYNARSYFNDFKEKLNAAREFIKLCKLNENTKESYKFIFWAMFILAVDKKDAEEKLSLICDFARLLNISDNEIMYIFMVIKSVINQKNYEQEFLKEGKLDKVNDNVCNIFSRVLSICENSEVY